MRLLSYLEKQKEVWVTIILSIIFFLFRFPSLFEPNWYGDEGIYQAVARALRAGKILYVGAWDNKPPTLYYLYAFFDANQFQIRLFSLIIGVLSLIVFFYLSQLLLKKRNASILASVVFIFLFGTPILEGNIANAENFMLLPSLTALLLIYLQKNSLLEKTSLHLPLMELLFGKTRDRRLLFITGLILGISFTIKTVALFDFATICFIILFLIFPSDKKLFLSHWNVILKQLTSLFIPLITGFVLPMLGYFVYFLGKGALPAFISAAFSGNVSYVGYQNDFIVPQGLLIIRTIILIISLTVIFIKRKNISYETQIVLVWFVFSLYSAFFSNRPYPHYLLLLIPSTCILLGYSYVKKYTSFILASIVFIIVLLFYLHVTWTKNPFTYYPNFISYLSAHKSTEDYQQYFDANVPRNYAVAEYIRDVVKQKEDVFIWGNSAQIYVLANKVPPVKYTVAYHIAYNKQTIDETSLALQKINPEFIVILPDEKEKPFSLENYHYLMTIKDTTIYERIH